MSVTLIHYTTNRLPDGFAKKVREHLVGVAKKIDAHIISVSWKPMDFGENIVVGEKDGLTPNPSAYNVYRQIFIGAQHAKTKNVACCEDDSLYNAEHFMVKAPADKFLYNANRWHVNRENFYYRKWISMLACVASTELMVKTLTERFARFPEPTPGWAFFVGKTKLHEPGKSEKKCGLAPVGLDWFETRTPVITFNHDMGLGQVRRPYKKAKGMYQDSLPYWGLAKDLWREFFGPYKIGRRK